jgi:hypothetical protein
MKTREIQIIEDTRQGAVDPLHANRPMIFITTAVLIGGILMAVILKISPPDNPPQKPVAAKILLRR